MDPSRTRKPVSWDLGAVFIKVAMRRSGEGQTERLRDRSSARRLGSFLGLSRPRHHVGVSTAFPYDNHRTVTAIQASDCLVSPVRGAHG